MITEAAGSRTGCFQGCYIYRALKLGLKGRVMAEGVVFYNFKHKEEGQIWRSKLRRGMFDWYISDKIEINDYDKKRPG